MSPPNCQRVVVKDANIIIDLVNAGLFEMWFELGIETLTTDFVVDELRKGRQWSDVESVIQTRKLVVLSFDSEELLAIVEMSRIHRISPADGSVLFLSTRHQARLLTGDGKLRKAAHKSGIEANGVLWILDILVDESSLAKLVAAEALERMVSQGARLPPVETERRLRKWKG